MSPNIYEYFIYGFGFGKCIPEYSDKNKDVLILYYEKTDFYSIGNISTIAKECPWSWATKCEWNSYHISFRIPSNIVNDISNVTIFNLYTLTKHYVKIKRPFNKKKYKDDFTICIPPLYWYNNFLEIFIFTEIWALFGASHFIYYYYSISKDVMRLLKYYQSNGIVTLIPYKSLPKSNITNPNKSIYRYGHLAAINDCLHRRYSKYSTVLDVDEFLFINDVIIYSDKTFFEHIDDLFEMNYELSGLLFSHRGLKVDTNSMKNDFKFLENTYITDHDSAKKYIIKTDRVETVNSHTPIKYMNYPVRTMNIDKAFLLHLHFKWAYNNKNLTQKFTFITPKQIEQIKNKFFSIYQKLKQPKKFGFETNALKIMKNCIVNWKKIGCKVPDDLCGEKILKIEKWVTANDNYRGDEYHII